MYDPQGMAFDRRIYFVLTPIYFKIHYHILLISTAFVGSSAFMLGVDCFTTAGLKEVNL